MSSSTTPLLPTASPEVVEQTRSTSRSRRNAQAGPGPSTVASRSNGVVPHPLSRSHTVASVDDGLSPEEKIRKKELELARIADRHDDMIRELYHMENFVTLIVGFDPAIVKRERSAAFLEYQAPKDLFARFASASSSSIGVGRLSSRTSRRTLIDQTIKPPAPAASKSSMPPPAVPHSPRSRALGKGMSKEDMAEVEDYPVLQMGFSESPQKAPSGSAGRADGRPGDGVPKRSHKKAVVVNAEVEPAASAPMKKKAPYKEPTVGKRKSGRERLPAAPRIEVVPSLPPGNVGKRKSTGETSTSNKRIKLSPTPPSGPPPPMKYTHPDQIPIEDIIFEGPLTAYLESYRVLDEKELEQKDLDAQALAAARVYARVRALQGQGRMLDALAPVRSAEVDGGGTIPGAMPGALRAPVEHRRLPDHQSHLLGHVLQVGTAMKLEHRNHIFAARKLSKAVQAHFEHLSGKGDREKKELERQKKAVMKELVKAIKGRWKMAMNVVRARRQAEAKREQERLGKVHLQEMLDRSTGLIEAQRNAMVEGTPKEESEEEESEEEESEESEEEGGDEGEAEEDEDPDDDGVVPAENVLVDDEDVTMRFADDDEDGATDEEEPADVTGEEGFESGDDQIEAQDPAVQSPTNLNSAAQPVPKGSEETVDAEMNGISSPGQEAPRKRRRKVKRSRRSNSGSSSARTDDPDVNDIEFEGDEDVDDQDREMDIEMEEEEGSAASDSEDDGLMADADLPIEELLKRYGYGDDILKTIAVPKTTKPTITEVPTNGDVAMEVDAPEDTAPLVEDEESGVRRSARERKIRTIRDSYSPIAKATTATEPLINGDDDGDVYDEEEEDNVSVFSDRSNGQGGVEMRPPFLLRGTLRPYQHAGLEWLAGLYKNRVNGILADEMGLGKTIQTIALLAHLACDKGVWGPHLIVVPTSVILNWEMEFKKFLPGMKVLTYYGNQKERKERRIGWATENFFQVCITSYQLVLADQHIFRRKAWKYLILDEAHNIKNFRSQRWQTLLGFRSERRLLLTGTPLQNNLMELWSLMYFLMPHGVSDELTKAGGFANHKEFSEWFANPMEKAVEAGETMTTETRETIDRLHTILRPYMLRRLKSEVETQLPGKFEHVTYCKLSKRQRFLYDEFMSRASTRESLITGGYLGVANCLMQLRKVCNHPDLFEVRPVRTSFAIDKSVVSDFEDSDYLVRKRLLAESGADTISLSAIQLSNTTLETRSAMAAHSTRRLDATDRLPYAGQPKRVWPEEDEYASRTLDGWQARLAQKAEQASESRWSQIRYNNRFRCSAAPLYGCELLGKLRGLSVNHRLMTGDELARYPPHRLESEIEPLSNLIFSLRARAEKMAPIIDKFAVIPPNAVARDLASLALPSLDLTETPEVSSLEFDTLHRSTVKLQIAFPDASLLQYDCGKLQVLHDMLKNLKAGGHRVIIFTQMTKMLDILELFLSHQGHRYFRLDGGTKIEERQRITERFNSDDRIFCFIASTRAGGVGINLTGADTVIFYDADYNVAMDRQAMDRAHRIGQTREVHIHRLVTLHTVEENILKKSNQKRLLDNLVIQEGNFTTLFYEKMDLRDMLGPEILASIAPPKPTGSESPVAGVGVGERELDERELDKAFAMVDDEDDARAARVAQGEVGMDDTEFAGGREGVVGGSGGKEGEAGPEGEGGTPVVDEDGDGGDVVEDAGVEAGAGDEEEEEEEEAEERGVDDYMLAFLEWQLDA